MESGHSLSQVSSLKLISEELVLYQILKVEATCQIPIMQELKL